MSVCMCGCVWVLKTANTVTLWGFTSFFEDKQQVLNDINNIFGVRVRVRRVVVMGIVWVSHQEMNINLLK